MSQITLFGGLASTVLWPVDHLLLARFGWRGALLVNGVLALLTIPLVLSIPDARHGEAASRVETADHALPTEGRDTAAASVLFATGTALTNFLNVGMSSHMIPILIALGLSSAAAVAIATLRGVGQSAARLAEVVFGHRIDALTLNVASSGLIVAGFAIAMVPGPVAATIFAASYGAGNGLATITRGTLPLLLFDPRTYGTVVGRLLTPGFLLSATAPVAYAFVLERYGGPSAIYLSAVIAALITLTATLLRRRCAHVSDRRARTTPV
jgi:Major Facilitator Superfamily